MGSRRPAIFPFRFARRVVFGGSAHGPVSYFGKPGTNFGSIPDLERNLGSEET
jgi:hypothetical protein